MELHFVWGADKFLLSVPAAATLGELKAALCQRTGIAPENQKIMGLRGAVRDNAAPLSPMLGTTRKLSLIGQPAAVVSLLEKEAKSSEAQARREEEERIKREGALDRLRLMRQAEEERERQRWVEERAREEERMSEERRERMAAMRRDEQAEEMQADATAEFSLSLFSSVFAPASNRAVSDSGDRMVMPPAVLQMLINARISMPTNFRVTCTRTERVCFCGVSEFNAPDGQAFAPHWFLEFLGAEEGEPVTFQSLTLPRAASIVLRPHSRNWQPLNQSDAGQALLSEQLSKLSCLFVGQTVEIQSQRSMFKFSVLEIQPADVGAVSLLHADVELHLVDPIDVTDAAPALSEKQETPGKIGGGGEFAYHSVLLRVGEVLSVQVKPKDASQDVDVFASSLTRFPTTNDFEFASVNSIGEKELILQGARQDTVYVIGITGKNAVDFGVKLAPASLQFQGGSHSNNDAVCDNCRKPIPISSLQLHSLRCRQLVFFCNVCNCSMPQSAKAKHEAVMHEAIVCSCGTGLLRCFVPEHKRQCVLRDERCAYCGLTMPVAELPEHRGSCGHKSAACSLCSFRGRRNEMAQHCLKAHQLYDPKPTKEWTLE